MENLKSYWEKTPGWVKLLGGAVSVAIGYRLYTNASNQREIKKLLSEGKELII